MAIQIDRRAPTDIVALRNNARTVTTTALAGFPGTADFTEFTVTSDGAEEDFAEPQPFDYAGGGRDALAARPSVQYLTITHPSLPGEYEIVGLRSRSGTAFVVDRSLPLSTMHPDFTPAIAWPAGAIVEARITAGMLDSFLAAPGAGRVVRTETGKGFRVNCMPSPAAGNNVQIAGWPILETARAVPGTYAHVQDDNLSRVVVGGSPPVELGAVKTWTASQPYPRGSVVAPTTPDGSHYFYEPVTKGVVAEVVSQSPTEPAFAGGRCDAVDHNGDFCGYWIATPADRVITQSFSESNGVLVPDEVGFICTGHTSTMLPSISIGTTANPARFASNVSLMQIAGAPHTHRIPVQLGGPACSELVFTLNAPADADFTGRFYWRGFLFQVE